MQVRKSSWHWPYYEYWVKHSDSTAADKIRSWPDRKRLGYDSGFWKPEPLNLCRYFWRVPRGLFLKQLHNRPIVTVASLAIVALLVVSSLVSIGETTFLAALLGTVAYAVGSAVLFAIIYLLVIASEKYKENKKGPGLVTSFVKAKKQKVCPLIEVVDE